MISDEGKLTSLGYLLAYTGKQDVVDVYFNVALTQVFICQPFQIFVQGMNSVTDRAHKGRDIKARKFDRLDSVTLYLLNNVWLPV